MAFFDDFRDLIVSDPSINAAFSPRIYFQLLPKDIDKDKTWLRWGFTRADDTKCIGGGTAQQTYNVFIDVLSKNINSLPGYGDVIYEQFENKQYKGIKNIKITSDLYSNYQEEEIYVYTMNFSVVYK